MKATLEFNLDEPDDEVSYTRCVKAKDMALLIWDYDNYLRGEGKYNDDPLAVKHGEEFRAMLEKHNINFDEIII
jgi:hypothetical protein